MNPMADLLITQFAPLNPLNAPSRDIKLPFPILQRLEIKRIWFTTSGSTPINDTVGEIINANPSYN
jgi:hypothetical protein